ncbi:3-hydroxyacyl-CoA dehydrogenase family protein [Nonomuraea gerenzanensis]|uniref:3-hydroxybutyryl-CoA dehydrogenase 3-hydroxyacyl-CoA dehydrogenase n=1 Tax=Nonomuraea gerenzanensis TaxID=93944 RepID=A0A1M4EFY9_9ACTN|nr:3-hydroxyacyl-CoA dehydrogenase family protein [Nonomuraea gerenzanensis]UBU09306.1 3-hydroxyacyl-CoA dehydrogenase family protein [Nonomuraea gerenzanensis]SBO97712.1 3-hydroxybutyryl-CoA dehydrogenase; 3-hydroxyacyl-CoA dehydrogenase [Nonomuraea gerenzanensis]
MNADLPSTVGVVGGGRMGAGIAHAFLVAGGHVVIVESSAETAAAARARVGDSLAKAAAKGTLGESAEAASSRLRAAADPAGLAGCELVIEAVPEDPALKAEVLALAEKQAPGAVLATNTSSLSLAGLAAGLAAPERFLGLHFFNPVPVSDLVEIVVAPRTEPELVTRAQGWVAALGKTPITVADSPGFASSRLGVCLALEAMRMLEEGVASAADIDTAMTLGYRHPLGPLRTTDLVGLDVRLAIAEHLARELGPRFEPPRILRDLVAAGHLGRKTGQGFYTW